MVGVLATILGPLGGAGFKSMAKVVVLCTALLLPVGTYFLGRYHEAQQTAVEIAEAAEKRTLVSVKENVRRAERAGDMTREREDTLDEKLNDFTTEVEAAGGCSCTATDSELLEYNELVQEANRGMSGDRAKAVRGSAASNEGK